MPKVVEHRSKIQFPSPTWNPSRVEMNMMIRETQTRCLSIPSSDSVHLFHDYLSVNEIKQLRLSCSTFYEVIASCEEIGLRLAFITHPPLSNVFNRSLRTKMRCICAVFTQTSDNLTRDLSRLNSSFSSIKLLHLNVFLNRPMLKEPELDTPAVDAPVKRLQWNTSKKSPVEPKQAAPSSSVTAFEFDFSHFDCHEICLENEPDWTYRSIQAITLPPTLHKLKLIDLTLHQSSVLAQITSLQSLQSLEISGRDPFNFTTIVDLSPCSNLKHLTIKYQNQIIHWKEDHIDNHIVFPSSLQTLHLSGVVSHEAQFQTPPLPELKYLYIGYPVITNSTETVRCLDLEHTTIDSLVLQSGKYSRVLLPSRLRQLELREKLTIDREFDLSVCKHHLQSLRIEGKHISLLHSRDFSLNLSECHQLSHIDIDSYTTPSHTFLLPTTSLRTLKLRRTRLYPSNILHCGTLEELCIKGPHKEFLPYESLDRGCVLELTDLDQLRTLTLMDCELSDIRLPPQIREVTLIRVQRPNDVTFSCPQFCQMKRLVMKYDVRDFPNAVQPPYDLSKMNQLEQLTLDGLFDLSHTKLPVSLRTLNGTHLVNAHLQLDACTQLTNASIDFTSMRLPKGDTIGQSLTNVAAPLDLSNTRLECITIKDQRVYDVRKTSYPISYLAFPTTLCTLELDQVSLNLLLTIDFKVLKSLSHIRANYLDGGVCCQDPMGTTDSFPSSKKKRNKTKQTQTELCDTTYYGLKILDLSECSSLNHIKMCCLEDVWSLSSQIILHQIKLPKNLLETLSADASHMERIDLTLSLSNVVTEVPLSRTDGCERSDDEGLKARFKLDSYFDSYQARYIYNNDIMSIQYGAD